MLGNDLIFREVYSVLYDEMHSNKDYQSSSKTIQTAILNNFTDAIHILDFGCGTGRYTSALSDLGFDVCGYDISPQMISKARANFPTVTFYNELDSIKTEFEVVISMFDVINYQYTKAMLDLFLSQISNLLKPGGLFIMDGWNSRALIESPPVYSSREFEFQGKLFKRSVKPSYLPTEEIWKLDIDIHSQSDNDPNSSEIHYLKSWSVSELKLALSKFEFVEVEFFDLELNELMESSWRFLAVAKKGVS